MTIFNLLDRISANLPDTQQATSRRALFTSVADLGKKMAVAAVPIGAATAVYSPKAFAQENSVIDVLNFALLLEYLESEYYIKGLDSGVIPSGSDEEKVFMQISKHESAHVEFLKAAISGSGGEPIDKPEFDFSARGNFWPFHKYKDFLVLSQAFEDTGVRAYKGQAANLIGNDAVLTAALQIHSVEASHASKVRRIRGLKGWITEDERGDGMPAATQAVYDGEDQLVQAGIDLTSLTAFGADSATESYDEPLTKEEVTAIASLFLA